MEEIELGKTYREPTTGFRGVATSAQQAADGRHVITLTDLDEKGKVIKAEFVQDLLEASPPRATRRGVKIVEEGDAI